jgi:hypothetical protein
MFSRKKVIFSKITFVLKKKLKRTFGLGLILPGSFYRGNLNSDFYSPQKLDFFLILF